MFATLRSNAQQGRFGYSLQRLSTEGRVKRGQVANMAVIHAGCLFAPFCFDWWSFGIAVPLGFAIGICVTICYHRLLSHGSFETFGWVRDALALFAQLSLNGPAPRYVAVHHAHHAYSDTDLDPHSPVRSFWWGHFFCTLQRHMSEEDEYVDRFSKGLRNIPFMRFQERIDPWILPLQLAVLFGIGALVDGWYGAFSLMIWAGCVRMTIGFHINASVNSIAHARERFQGANKHDLSKNVPWLASLTFGEGLHQDHHENPRRVYVGKGRWRMLDTSYMVLRVMRKLGLAWNLYEGTAKSAAVKAA